MKYELSQSFVVRLDINRKPEIVDGKLTYLPNDGTPYYVFDEHRDAPVGFGVKVQKTKKVYIIQRKVHGRLFKPNVGNVRDFNSIEHAREKAREMIDVIKKTKRNPNDVERENELREITVGGLFEKYTAYLNSRQPPVKPNSWKAYKKAVAKLEAWHSRRVIDLTSEEIQNRFNEIATTARTTAEQTFRWAMRATNYVIDVETYEANRKKREPLLQYSPFEILRINKQFRSRDQLEEEYKVKGVRNPLSPSKMGDWLDAIWGRRLKNRTAGDFMLCCTLWGTRKSEAACVKWRDRISDEESKITSWVDLNERKVFFYNTKNSTHLELPLGDCAYEIMKQRHEITNEQHAGNERLWLQVFPAESKFSKVAYYSNVNSIMGYTRDDAGISRLSPHDLRRTFATIAETEVGLPYNVVKRLVNHKIGKDVTGKYVQIEWARMCEYMQRMEDEILMKSPTVYNALKPANKPRIEAKS